MAGNNKVVSIDDGTNVTVDQVLGNPTAIPTRIIDLVRNNIVGETMFRNAGNPGNLLIQFQRSTPLYLDGDPEAIAEFGEIPVFDLGEGQPDVARAVEIGAAVRVSKLMRNFNQIDKLRKQVTGVANTVIRANDLAFQSALTAANVPSVAATAAWTNKTAARPIDDVVEATDTVSTATFNGDPSQPLGFIPDTLVIHPSNLRAWAKTDNYKGLFVGNMASENIAFTGKLTEKLLGLTVLVPQLWPLDKALVMQRGVTGFYADPQALQSTGMYGEGGGPNGGPTQTWRSDTTQIRAIGVDEPKSACWITGLR